MRVAFLSPLPPVRSGIAGISAMLLPHLVERLEVTAVIDQKESPVIGLSPSVLPIVTIEEYREIRDQFDVAVYQLGNNPYHEWIYDEALEYPGVAVLHDAVLHHLIVEKTLARGDAEEFIRILEENHGAPGAAWARARAAGWHTELSNFLYPASIVLTQRSRRVIVHNRHARAMLEGFGVRTPIDVIDLPLADALEVAPAERPRLRAELGFSDSERVIGMFGFVTEAKRPELVFAAFAKASRLDPSLRLLVVGEPAPSVDLDAIAQAAGVSAHLWKATGYVGDEDFERYLAAVDRVVSLRYPSAGETSGAILRIFHAGKPVAVNDYAQFGELPDDLCTKISFGEDEEARLAEFMGETHVDPGLAAGQRAWLRQNADVQQVAERYVEILHDVQGTRSGSEPMTLTPAGVPLFPGLRIDRIEAKAGEKALHVRVVNDGEDLLRAAVYGEPSYRLITHVRREGVAVEDRWLSLTGDLAPGAGSEIDVRLGAPLQRGDVLAFFHGIEGIPSIELPPFHEEEVA